MSIVNCPLSINMELRSEAVEEVMGRIPPGIVRWGITVLFGVVLLLLAGSCFFRSPETVTAEMTLTSRNPVAEVVTGSSGRIAELYVESGRAVKEGLPLAVIEGILTVVIVIALETYARNELKSLSF